MTLPALIDATNRYAAELSTLAHALPEARVDGDVATRRRGFAIVGVRVATRNVVAALDHLIVCLRRMEAL